MKKKLVAWLTAAVFAVTLAACGAEGNTAPGSASSESSKAASEASAASSASSASASSAASSASSEASSASSAESSAAEASSASSAPETAEESETHEVTYTEEEQALLDIPLTEEDVSATDCVELCDYSNVDVKDAYTAPTEDDIQQYIDARMVAVEVEDPNALVAEGDTANIDYVGKIDGEAFEGGTGSNYDLIIGSGTFIPGFEDGVIGMKAGEVKDIEVGFPDDYWNEDMAGKPAVFTVTLNSIKHIPEFNDDWVAKYSETEETTVEGYRAYVADMMEKNARQMALESEQMELLQYIVDNSTVKQIPKSYVENAEASFDASNEAQAQSYGMTLTELLETAGYTQEDYDKMKSLASRESAKNTVLYDAIWEKEGLTEEGEEYKQGMLELEEAYGMMIEELEAEYGEETIHNYGKAYALLHKIINYANIVPAEETAETSASSAG